MLSSQGGATLKILGESKPTKGDIRRERPYRLEKT